MTGARITATFDDAALERAMRTLRAALMDDLPVMQEIGKALVETTQHRFNSETDPSGHAWAKLNPAYAAMKRTDYILRESGKLYENITFYAGHGQVEVGTNRIYGAVQQFGAVIRPKQAKALVFRLGSKLVRVKNVTIPARPYLGFGAADRGAVEDVLAGMFHRAMRS